MIKISKNKEDVLKVVDQWIRLLAAGDYKTAYEMTFHPEDDPLTLEILEKLIKTYTNMEGPEDCYVTLPEKTTLSKEVVEFMETNRTDNWRESYRPWEPRHDWYDEPLEGGSVGEVLCLKTPTGARR
ncbi:MAG: hypothetical protein AMXMBFR33_48670 [Candidatus Xenobia bacterium]